MNAGTDNAVEYARRLYDDVRDWYDNADSKAQVVLAIDGAFMAFLTGAIFAKPGDLREIVGSFSVWTWSLLALMTLCLMASVSSAIYCLWSRIYSAGQLQELVEAAQRAKGDSDQYAPKWMWFFQMVANLEEKRFHTTLEAVDGPFETEAMAAQIQILSRNVRTKHRAVNAGFVLAAMTLVLFFLAGLSYLARIVG
jgi:hypothetical protein